MANEFENTAEENVLNEMGYYYENHNIDDGYEKLLESIKYYTKENIENFLYKKIQPLI